ncbi:hypothetical protein KRR40_38885 [Niabella defluvii]|nr:hypothetical protein KRR40_38885 [Niabella sp. I65]
MPMNITGVKWTGTRWQTRYTVSGGNAPFPLTPMEISFLKVAGYGPRKLPAAYPKPANPAQSATGTKPRLVKGLL